MITAQEAGWITEDKRILKNISEMKGGSKALRVISIYSKLIRSAAERGEDSIEIDIEPFNLILSKDDSLNIIQQIEQYFRRYGYATVIETNEVGRVTYMSVGW